MDINTNSKKHQKILKKEELVDFAKEFLDFLRKVKEKINKSDKKNEEAESDPAHQAVVIGLMGDLGAGKTTFSQTIARELGVEDVVNSPTFAIQKTYTTVDKDFAKFVHIDAYRIEAEKEMEVLRFVELIKDSKNLVFVEWPTRIPNLMPVNSVLLEFETIDQDTRKISYQVSY